MEHFQKNSAATTVPCGVMFFKETPYAVRATPWSAVSWEVSLQNLVCFYTSVGRNSVYLYFSADYRSGIKLKLLKTSVTALRFVIFGMRPRWKVSKFSLKRQYFFLMCAPNDALYANSAPISESAGWHRQFLNVTHNWWANRNYWRSTVVVEKCAAWWVVLVSSIL